MMKIGSLYHLRTVMTGVGGELTIYRLRPDCVYIFVSLGKPLPIFKLQRTLLIYA